MNKTLVVVLVLVLILAGGYFLLGKEKVEAPMVADEGGSMDNVSGDITSTMPAGDGSAVDEMLVGGDAVAPEEGVKSFVVDGGNFKFTPNVMNVKLGDKVKVTFKNTEGFHDLKLDEFGVATPQIKAGEEAVVEFVADKVGSFEYYCSVGQHRAMGMKGTLTVTE